MPAGGRLDANATTAKNLPARRDPSAAACLPESVRANLPSVRKQLQAKQEQGGNGRVGHANDKVGHGGGGTRFGQPGRRASLGLCAVQPRTGGGANVLLGPRCRGLCHAARLYPRPRLLRVFTPLLRQRLGRLLRTPGKNGCLLGPRRHTKAARSADRLSTGADGPLCRESDQGRGTDPRRPTGHRTAPATNRGA